MLFFSGTSISWKQTNFIEIIGTMLITTNVNLTLIGSPTTVDGWKGGLAVDLNGKDQLIDSPGNNNCLSEPDNCLLGMTFKISLKLFELKENMYILTSGGDQQGGRGVSLYYWKKRLYLTISTVDKEWTVKTKFTKVNAFFDLEFSWSIDGLELFIDGISVGKRLKYIKRKIKGYKKYKYRFGGPLLGFGGFYARCTVGTWQTWTATITIKNAVGVLSGMSQLILFLCRMSYCI